MSDDIRPGEELPKTEAAQELLALLGRPWEPGSRGFEEMVKGIRPLIAAIEQQALAPARTTVSPGDGDGLREAAKDVDAGWLAIEDGDDVRMRYASDLPARLNRLRAALDPEAGDGR